MSICQMKKFRLGIGCLAVIPSEDQRLFAFGKRCLGPRGPPEPRRMSRNGCEGDVPLVGLALLPAMPVSRQSLLHTARDGSFLP